MGPKDWLPGWEKIKAPLTHPEHARFHEIRERLSRGEEVVPDDVKWLCDKLEALSKQSLFEFEFPEYAGFVKMSEEKAWAMKFKQVLAYRWSHTPKENSMSEVIADVSVSCRANEAACIVRPWIHLPKCSQDVEEAFKAATLTFYYDSIALISREPVVDYAAGPSGIPYRRMPKNLGYIWKDVFGAVLLDQNQEARTENTFAIFASHGTRLVLDLHWPETTIPKVKFQAGIVGGMYSTNAD